MPRSWRESTKPNRHTLSKKLVWLPLALILAGALAAVSRAEEPEAMKALKRAWRNASELIQTGRFPQAVEYLRRSTAQFPDDAELHRLLAAAALDRAMELDNEFETAQSRLSILSQIRATVRSEDATAFKDSAAMVDAAVTDATQTYQKSLLARREVAPLLAETLKEAEAAIGEDGTASGGVLMAVWIDAYRIIEADEGQIARQRLERFPAQDGSPTPLLSAGDHSPSAPFDRKAVRRHALHLLSRMVQARPDDPLPYLAAAEWLQLTEPADLQSKLNWVRNWRFRNGNINSDRATDDRAAQDEYQTARHTRLGDLEAVGPAQSLALYEQAAKLDPKDGHGTAYALYIQALPGDEERGRALLAKVAVKEPGNALIPLERARLAAANGAYDRMLRELTAATTATRFHSPLFTTLPREIRRPFLSAHLVWDRLEEAGFGFQFIERGAQSLRRYAVSSLDQQHLALLKAHVGALLMQSDLPHDWVLGAKLRRDSLGALARDKELPPDLAARAQADLARIRAEIAAQPLPLQSGILWQNRLLMESAVGDDLTIIGPFIMVNRSGESAVGS